MKPHPIVKITVLRTDQDEQGIPRTRTGTGYVIADGLILTAHHVVEFEERDKSQPIQLEWTKLSREDAPCKAQMTGVIWANHDVAVLACVMPDLVKAHLMALPKLAASKVTSCKRWETAGYPKINQFLLKDSTGEFGSDLGDPTITLNLTVSYDRTQVPEELATTGWGGMSGAPVFNIDSGQLQAVITVHNLWMEKQLQAVSIPYLLADKDLGFRQAVGLDDNAIAIQKFFDGQKQQIKAQLKEMQSGSLCQELVKQLDVKVADNLAECLLVAFDQDNLGLLDTLLKASIEALKHDSDKHGEASRIRVLFFLFVSLMTSQSVLARETVMSLSVRTRMATELHLAPAYDVNPTFDLDKDGLPKGCWAEDASVFVRETGWDIAKQVEEAIKVIDTQVRQKPRSKPLDEFECEELNTTLKQRQSRELGRLHRIELDQRDEAMKSNPFADPEFCKALKAADCLPDLPIVYYGKVAAPQEAKLRAKLRDLFEILKPYGYAA